MTNGAATTDHDMDVRDAIQRVALEWPSYGRPRITAALRRQGWASIPNGFTACCVKTTYCVCGKRKFLVTTDSNHKRPIYPNLGLDRLTTFYKIWQ